MALNEHFDERKMIALWEKEQFVWIKSRKWFEGKMNELEARRLRVRWRERKS